MPCQTPPIYQNGSLFIRDARIEGIAPLASETGVNHDTRPIRNGGAPQRQDTPLRRDGVFLPLYRKFFE
ncbi:MAG: hypothetical protein ACJAU6_003892 [Alphaproteobacteria bacterium]|jgi:hypothetical protein